MDELVFDGEFEEYEDDEILDLDDVLDESDIKVELDSTVEDFSKYSLEELEQMLKDHEYEQKNFYNMEQAVKLTLNSIYGAFGNEWFYFFKIDIAETITLQGQDAILYTEDRLNRYFIDQWNEDIETHKAMGIKVTGIVRKPVVIYIDTDSCYLTFEEILEKSDWSGSEQDFILKLYSVKLEKYIKDILELYAKDNNTDNYLKFELENISKSAIWLAKKKYIMDQVWKDPDIHFKTLTKIKAKGFETVQSATPQFVREALDVMLKYVFSDEKITMQELAKRLKDIKRRFKLESPEKISKNLKINKYTPYIDNDVTALIIAKGCPIHVRGSAYHNYLLNNSKYKNKYHLINSGDKVKMYYALDKNNDVFSFLPGEFPYEFAPQVDYDVQFEKTVIDPMNRVLKVMNLQQLDKNLIYSISLF